MVFKIIIYKIVIPFRSCNELVSISVNKLVYETNFGISTKFHNSISNFP